MRFPSDPVRHAANARFWSAWYSCVTLRLPSLSTDWHPFIVTGPPRSGTSLLAALLNRKPNVIVVNEPHQLDGRRLLASHSPATLLRGFLTSVARRAFHHGTVVNKADPDSPDRPTTDTRNRGAVRRAIPVNLDRARPFCVAAKEPMPFMDNLDAFCDSWPTLRAIIIARDPVATIDSWRRGFGWQPGLDDPRVGPRFHLHNRVPANITDPLEKRAHLWRIVIDEALAQRARRPERIQLICYDELIRNPAAIAAAAARHIAAPSPDAPIDSSDVKPPKASPHRFESLSPGEIDLIRNLCSPAWQSFINATRASS